MRDRMERLVILPFSFGCASEATVAVGISHPRRARPETKSPAKAIRHKGDKDISESLCGESMKNLLRFDENVPKSSTSPGFKRRFKGFKNFPLLSVDKEEMEIGCPTDVQHVTHIGWDGIAGTATATTTEPLSSLPSQRYHLSNSSFEPKPGKSSSSSV